MIIIVQIKRVALLSLRCLYPNNKSFVFRHHSYSPYICAMERKILIVGGGLAGLCLGVQLYRRNIPFQIWTSDSIPCASEKAAGLMNPIVVKRLLKTWMADEVLPYNHSFYPEVEQLTQRSFFFRLPVYRMFSNALVQGEWKARVADGTMDGLMSPNIYAYAPHAVQVSAYEGADIFQASMVDCEVFVTALRQFFQENNALKTVSLAYSDIVKQESGYRVGEETFSEIVFCEGMHAVNNPWFGKLPLLPTKGELLYLDIPDFPMEKEVMKGVFLAPLKRGGFVCGSTYEWQFDDENPSEQGKQKILDQLHEITDKPYTIRKHTACIRPASKDRRPYLGEHPTKKGLFVFNGLGTKGYMLAPYFSSVLADHILENGKIEREYSIERLFKHNLFS